MRALKVLFPVVIGIVITFGVMFGFASASSDSKSPAVPAATTIYVDANNTSGTTDGASWATAYTDLQVALAVAFSGDQIWVATGVYTPGIDQSDSFNLVPGVALYGGFDPAGGADQFSERDWEAYPTILSGDIGGDDTNTDGVVLTTTHIITPNSYHVVTARGTSTPITSTTILDGFTITAGGANGGYPDHQGGGFYCAGHGSGAECSPSFRSITFSGNSAASHGGAMYNSGYQGTSSPTLSNVVFSGNSADHNGGAMYNNGPYGTSSPVLEDVTFFGNSAEYGGALFNNGHGGASNPKLSNVTFSGNSADHAGGAMHNDGHDGASNPTLYNVTFSGNSAGESGGAMFNRGDGGNSSPVLENVIFSGNSADSGGAMCNYGYEGISSPTLSNVIFSGNSADQGGGAMLNRGERGNSSPNLANITFSGNKAEHGGAMYNNGSEGGTSSPNLYNLILWGNTATTGSQMYNIYASPIISTSLVQEGITGSGIINNNSTLTDGGGNIDADPAFVSDPDPGPDGRWDGVSDDYGDLHLGAGSPAIDTGTNSAITLTVDLDGNPRFVDGDNNGSPIVDMGAYEFSCPIGTILYVDHTADGSGYGSSWTDAQPNLTLGLYLADYCPTVDQVWVATGVYTPGIYQTDSFTLPPGVAVYGGFDPAGNADEFNERDWGAYPTILSGDISGDDTNTGGVLLTTTHIIGDNNNHVVTADGTSTPITSTTVLDGFTITAGQSKGAAPDTWGGGLYCDGHGNGSECSLSLSNLTFSGNSAERGGAMYNNGNIGGFSNPSLTNVDFSGNSASISGGAMFNYGVEGNSSPSLSNVSFSDNSAEEYGGAMYNFGYIGTSSPRLRNVTFSGNSAGILGGAIFNDGEDGTSSPSLSNVIFSANSAGNRGGAMYNYGILGGTSSPSLANVTFSGNSAIDDAGAMYNDGYQGTSSPNLANVTFSGNLAGYGGAMYNYGPEGTSSPNLTNVTFSGNTAYFGGAIYNNGETGTSSPNLSNLVLWGNTAVFSGSQMYNFYASSIITTSLVQGGITGTGVFNDIGGSVNDGGGNLDADPLFLRDPDPGPDGDWDGLDDDYGDLHLGAGSPAIDTGTNSAITLTVDLDGYPRVMDGDNDGTAIVDMGAYEYGLPQTLTVTLAGDGGGTVTGTGINCFEGTGADCTETYPFGTLLTLSASADPGSTFTGWSGACDGVGNCQVTMDKPISLTATFYSDIKHLFLPLVLLR